METFRLENKNIVITGASSGFGHHFSAVLAKAGARVVLGARRIDKIEARVAEIRAAGGEAVGVTLDVRNNDSINDFLEGAEQAFGPIDVVINNAGVQAGAKTYMMIDEGDWDFVMETNLKSAWLMAKAYTERVVKNAQPGGNIINISSITDTRTIKRSREVVH